MEISIINILSLFAAIPSVTITKVLTLGYNIAPDERVESLTNWKAADYYPDSAHDIQSNSSKADIDYGLSSYLLYSSA